MTFEQAVEAHARYLVARRDEAIRRSWALPDLPEAADAEAAILAFLEREDADTSEFGRDVRIILASADFSKLLTTSAMWLWERGIDIRCVRLRPYRLPDSERLLLDIQQIIPLPEVGDYQVKVATKNRLQRAEPSVTRERRRFWLRIRGQTMHGLAKRWLALRAVEAVIRDGGITPEAVSAGTAEGARRRLFVSFPGSLARDEFVTLAASTNADLRRWFIGDDQLFRVGDETAALTNQWGLSTESFVQDLLDRVAAPLGLDASFGPEDTEDDLSAVDA